MRGLVRRYGAVVWDDQQQSARPRRPLLSPWRSRRLASARRDARASPKAARPSAPTMAAARQGKEASRPLQ